MDFKFTSGDAPKAEKEKIKVVFSGRYEDTPDIKELWIEEGIEEIAENAFDYSGYEGKFKAFLASKGEPK